VQQKIATGVSATLISTFIAWGVFARPEQVVQAEIRMRDYTDQRIELVLNSIDKRLNRIENKLDNIKN
jgi:hypothetical protein